MWRKPVLGAAVWFGGGSTIAGLLTLFVASAVSATLYWETAVFFSSSVLSIYIFGALLGRFVGGNSSAPKDACKAACLGASIVALSYMVGGVTTCVAMRMNGQHLPHGIRAEFAMVVLHYTKLTWFVVFPLFIGLSLKLCQLRKVKGPRTLGCGGEHE
jgi:hypothetical protein